MSEELIQRGLTEHGTPFGPYEFYNIGSTSIRALWQYKIVPWKSYERFENKKPDGLLVDRRDLKNISVIAVVENKAPGEFNTPEKQEKAVEQCVLEYCKPLDAKVGIVTDANEYIWVNPQLSGKEFEIILREDGYPLHLPFTWASDIEVRQTLEVLARVLTDISSTNSQLKKEELQNPSNLADRVWQTIWLASGDNPDTCLATFVEIFVFKYLSDLGVLVQNRTGVDISFSDTLAKGPDKCLVFYFEHVRPYIKEVFPPGSDGTSIINSTVLDEKIKEHNFIFYQLMREFEAFGPLTNIDPEFKSRLYEHFLKKSISQKNWGQFFTPRNIVKAMIEMSGIEQLADGAKVHDPACGVGGFVLEPILTKRQRDYYFDDSGHLRCKLEYTGHDRDIKTVILAKANMLIHLSELMRSHAAIPTDFASMFNKTFASMHTSILGSIAQIPHDEYDLIMTNPPFVVTGTSKVKEFIEDNKKLQDYYAINATGVEGLFVEKIIRSLKPASKALIIVPDGIMNRLVDKKLRKFIRDECIIEAIVSLPKNAFYTSQKKTYILVVTKKPVKGLAQTEPVFTYLVVNTGETLDANRFECENDLPEMVRLFKYFKADKDNFDSSSSKKCKVWTIDHFAPDKHWSVDRWWTVEEKTELGIIEERNLVTISEFAEHLDAEKRQFENAIEQLTAMDTKLPQADFAVEISLGDEQYFELFIGKRVLKRTLREHPGGTIPVYSANVKEPFGTLHKSNISSFDHDSVLWGIDGIFGFNVMRRNVPYATTDHCGCIRIIDADIDPHYLYHYLTWIRSTEGLDRTLRANLQNMKKIKVMFPVLADSYGILQTKQPNKVQEDVTAIYHLDIETQRRIAEHYRVFERIKSEIAERMQKLTALEIPPWI